MFELKVLTFEKNEKNDITLKKITRMFFTDSQKIIKKKIFKYIQYNTSQHIH